MPTMIPPKIPIITVWQRAGDQLVTAPVRVSPARAVEDVAQDHRAAPSSSARRIRPPMFSWADSWRSHQVQQICPAKRRFGTERGPSSPPAARLTGAFPEVHSPSIGRIIDGSDQIAGDRR